MTEKALKKGYTYHLYGQILSVNSSIYSMALVSVHYFEEL